ncbi:MAG: hypothetical protein EPN88_03425 [Bacteroidetes bacterium]|nr:MAG: hypothetical protein EPN88_03425 [Bacteroidota bacterium]
MRKVFSFFFAFTFYSLVGQVSTITWDYPVKPGSEKWKSLKSHMEMVEICQIPEVIIHKLSTKDLATICLDYPLFFTLTAFNNMQQGFEQVSTEFNGFSELYKRKDSGKELLLLYRELNPENIKLESTDLDKGLFEFKIFFLEFMLAQNKLFINLSQSELKELLIECCQKAKQKQNSKYSIFQVQSSYLVMARLLDFVQYNKFIEKYNVNPGRYDFFIKAVSLPDREILNEFDTMAIDFINSH